MNVNVFDKDLIVCFLFGDAILAFFISKIEALSYYKIIFLTARTLNLFW